MSFNIDDFLPPPTGLKRPKHPDFWRMAEISMQLRERMRDHAGDLEKQAQVWQASYEAIGDFDSIRYHALQCAIHLFDLDTGADFIAMRNSPKRAEAFIAAVQAFLDGFIIGAEFERRGGHQEVR